ncbi:hypothetical protein ACP275_04G144100 [Erythranthe tilingii]
MVMSSSKQREISNQRAHNRYRAIDPYAMLEGFRLDCEQLQKGLGTKSFQVIVDSLGIYGENDFANPEKKNLCRARYMWTKRHEKTIEQTASSSRFFCNQEFL